MLLHVVDITCHNATEQCQIVEDILSDLNLMDKPRITALNKVDLLLDNKMAWDEVSATDYLSEQYDATMDENMVLISAAKGWGLAKLLALISHTLSKTAQPV